MENKNNNLDFKMIVSYVGLGIVLIDRTIATIRFVGLLDYKSALHAILSIVMALITLWYLTYGYKIAHGNSLKNVFLLFTFYLSHHSVVDLVQKGYKYSGHGFLVASLIMAYVSGRLNKIEKNKYLLFIVGAYIVVDIVSHILVSDSLTLLRIISLSSPALLYISICLSYFNRYDAHIEAGLNK